jgi:molybdate transport system substrate-binding protein
MKRFIIVFVSIFCFFSNVYAGDLYWFVSAGIKKPSNKIVQMFNESHSDKVVVISGGTGAILQQMILSKKGDIYGCIDEKFFQLAKSKGIVGEYTKFLELTPVFGISKKSSKNINSFKDLINKNVKLAVGNPKTMALGKTYMYILKKLPKDMAKRLKKNITIKAINISQIVNYIKMGNVDAGMLFDAVAEMNGIKYIAIPRQYNQIKTGYIAKMNFAENKKVSDELFRFILKNLNVYRQFGFKVTLK